MPEHLGWRQRNDRQHTSCLGSRFNNVDRGTSPMPDALDVLGRLEFTPNEGPPSLEGVTGATDKSILGYTFLTNDRTSTRRARHVHLSRRAKVPASLARAHLAGHLSAAKIAYLSPQSSIEAVSKPS